MISHQTSQETQPRPALETVPKTSSFLQATLDTLSAHIALLDTSGTIIAVNRAWRQFGEANQLNLPFFGVGINYLEICETAAGPGQAEALAVAEGIREVLARHRETFEIEYPCHSPEEQRWFVTRVNWIEDSQMGGVVIVHENITERKQPEQAIRESEERFRGLVEGSIHGILVHRHNKPLFANQAYARILGYETSDEILSVDSVVTLIAPYERERLLGYLAARIKGEHAPSQYEFDAIRKDGSIVALQQMVNVIPWNGQPAVLAVTADVTERVRTVEQLKNSEARWRSLLRSLPAFVVEIDPEGIIQSLNQTQPGFTVDDFIGKAAVEVTAPAGRQAFQTAFTEVIEAGRVVQYEAPDFGPHNAPAWYGHQLAPILKDNKTVGVIMVVTDITERKQAEKALQDSEHYYRMLTESLTDYVLHLDSEGHIQYINRLAEGYTMDMVRGKHVMEFLAPEFHEAILQALKTVLETGQIVMFEDFGQQTATKQGWYFTRLVPISDSADITSVLLIATDITERKQAEAALQASEERFRQFISSISDHIYVTSITADEQKTNLYISPNVEILTGYPLEKFISDWDFWTATVIHPDDRSTAVAHAQRLITGSSGEMEYRMIRADGQVIWVRDSGRSVMTLADGSRTIYGVVSDITQRKQAEEAIRQREQELKRRNRELSLFNRIIAMSAVSLEPEIILENACHELARTLDIPQVAAALLNEDKTTALVVAEYRAEDRPSALNHVIPVEDNPIAEYILSHKTPLLIEDTKNDPRLATVQALIRQRETISLLILPLIIEGEVVGTLGLDIVEPHPFSPEEVNLVWSVADQVAGALARARLGQARRLLSAAVEQSAESVIITDTKGIIIYVNSTFEQLSGYSRVEALGQPPRFLKSGWHEAAFYGKLWATITAGQVWHGRLTNKRKDEKFYTIDAIITPVRDEKGVIVNYVALQRDVTRELQLEEQLRQSQKMEAIGRLAGGVAHDFNNLLTVITGYAELLLDSPYSSNDLRRRDLDHIKQASERAAMLTRQLLAFSRQQPLQLQRLNLNQVITNLESMLRRLLGEHLALRFDLAADLGYTLADHSQLEQIIINLAVNARDAMPGGGKLILTTANIELDEAYASQQLKLTPGPYVLLAMTDLGIGMDAETKSHIFEPFFTTKDPGKGTGLGLSIVYGIIEQNNGHIEVESAPGQGTTFKLYLPQVKPDANPAPPILVAPLSKEGNETILLVEDEASVRQITRRFLQERGYRVLEAGHAEEALRLCQNYTGQIDLLITDVVMPQMSGPELAKQLAKLSPNLKILFISGYADEELREHQAQNVAPILLEKPFSSDALVRRVREILNMPRLYTEEK